MVVRLHGWTTSAKQENLGGNQEGGERELCSMSDKSHLENGRFSAGAKTSDAVRQGLERRTGQEESRN